MAISPSLERPATQPAQPRHPRADAEDTRNRILDAAEHLFIEAGYSASSLRAIAQRAGVNLAATHYHFGSKAGLLSATLHRRTVPINESRIEQLDALLAREETPGVEEVMRAYLAPVTDPAVTGLLPQLISRIYGEPGGLATTLLEQEFGPTVGRFVAALQLALPDVEASELRWRFHFVIGAMVHLFNFDAPPGMPAAETCPEQRAERLLRFAVAGVCQRSGGDIQPGSGQRSTAGVSK